MSSFLNSLKDKLEIQKQKNLYRYLRPYSKNGQYKNDEDEKEFIDLSHNDYLGLSQNHRVIAAAQEASELWGTGAQASRLVTGDLDLHEKLENELAEFKGTEACLLFPTGYQASLSVMSCLPGNDDIIFVDRFVHACLVEGAQLSGAKLRVFPHQDLEKLEELLLKSKSESKSRNWIVVDGVYSMDGDIADLPKLLEIAKKTDSILVVDDAHGTGVIGKTGRGITEYYGIEAKDFGNHLILIATLSKALGAQGGAVLGAQEVRDFLINHAKAFIYTTGLNPISTAAALESMTLLNESNDLVSKLQKRSEKAHEFFRSREINILDTKTAIIPIIVGEESAALNMAEELRAQGLLVSAIRPPTVPRDTSRLRFVVNTQISEKTFDRVLDQLGKTVLNHKRFV